MIGKLPTSITIEGKEYNIETDYRNILLALIAFEDADLSDSEKLYILMRRVLRANFDLIPHTELEYTLTEVKRFINCGKEGSNKNDPKKLIDWEQDESLIFPAINKVAGKEVRHVDYMHWWTFMGYFMEIEEGIFSTVLGIRQKRAKGKKLDKWEQEFYANNKDICIIKTKYTQEEQEEIDRLNKLLG